MCALRYRSVFRRIAMAAVLLKCALNFVGPLSTFSKVNLYFNLFDGWYIFCRGYMLS